MSTCRDGSERQVQVLAETIARESQRGVSAVLREVTTPAGSGAGDGYAVEDEEL